MWPPFSASAKIFVLSFFSNYYCCIVNYPNQPMKQPPFIIYVHGVCGSKTWTVHSGDCSTFSRALARKTHMTRETWIADDTSNTWAMMSSRVDAAETGDQSTYMWTATHHRAAVFWEGTSGMELSKKAAISNKGRSLEKEWQPTPLFLSGEFCGQRL